MNIDLMTALIRKICFLSITVGLLGCGVGGSTGVGENEDESLTPIGNLTGDWQLTGTDSSLDPGCDNIDFSLGITISQLGQNLTLTGFRSSTLSGIMAGNIVTLAGTYFEDGGTGTIDSSSSTVTADCNQFTGNDIWSWTDGVSSCSGTSTYTGTRLSGNGCNGELLTENPIQLTNNLSSDRSPDMSNDGSKIVFHSSRTGNAEIWIMNADGSNQTKLTNTIENEGHAHFNTDNSQIVFWSERTGSREIWKMNSDGSSQSQLTNSNFDNGGAAWSPDNSQIVYRSSQSGNNDVWVMNEDGSNATQLTSSTAADVSPQFNSDGSKIVFSSNRDGNYDIWTMDVNGSNFAQLTSNSSVNIQPHYSPDGSQIIFESNRTGNYDLWRMDANGENQQQITTDVASDVKGDFNSDNTQVIFSSDRSGNRDIWIYTFVE